MASADKDNRNKVEPVFFLNNEIYQQAGKWLDTLEVCLAVCEVVSDENYVEGAQRIGGLWRVYITNLEARVQLLSTGINIRGCQITLKDKNPFINVLGSEDVDTTRVYVRNIPLSYDNGEIEKALRSKSVQPLGPIKYVRARTKEEKLTNFKTGDRFVDIITPKEPLPKKLEWVFSLPLSTIKNRNKAGQILSVETVKSQATSGGIAPTSLCAMTVPNQDIKEAVKAVQKQKKN